MGFYISQFNSKKYKECIFYSNKGEWVMQIFVTSFAGLQYLEDEELDYCLKSFKRSGILKDVLVVIQKRFVEKFNPPLVNYIYDNFKNINELLIFLQEYSKKNKLKFDSVLAIDDDDIFSISKRVSNLFNIPFHSKETRYASCNKLFMKLMFAKCGVPTADYHLINMSRRSNNSLDINKLVKRYGLRFPNVLKILGGNSSKFVFYNKSFREFECNLNILLSAINKLNDKDKRWFKKIKFRFENQQFVTDPKTQFLVEDFLDGEEFCCDFILCGGKLNFLRIAKKGYLNTLGHFAGFELLNKESIKNFFDLGTLLEICLKITLALAFKEGTCMVDFKVHRRKITVIEASARVGLNTVFGLMYYLYGYTSLEILSKFRLGDRYLINTNTFWPDAEGRIVYFFAKPGILKKFDVSKLQKNKKKLGLIKINKYVLPGMAIDSSKADSHDLKIGSALFRSECCKKSSFEEFLKVINTYVEIKTEPVLLER